MYVISWIQVKVVCSLEDHHCHAAYQATASVEGFELVFDPKYSQIEGSLKGRSQSSSQECHEPNREKPIQPVHTHKSSEGAPRQKALLSCGQEHEHAHAHDRKLEGPSRVGAFAM